VGPTLGETSSALISPYSKIAVKFKTQTATGQKQKCFRTYIQASEGKDKFSKFRND
jgi:hypothetical protein